MRRWALVAYMGIVTIAIVLVGQRAEEAQQELTVIERRLEVNPAQAFTPRQWCFVLKRATSSASFRMTLNGKPVQSAQIRCKRLGLHGESERDVPSTRLPLGRPKGGDASNSGPPGPN